MVLEMISDFCDCLDSRDPSQFLSTKVSENNSDTELYYEEEI